MQPRACSISGVRRAAHDTKGTRQNRVAQFIRICRWLQLIHKGWLAPLENTLFSTPWARKRCSVAQRFHQYLRATNCYKLSEHVYAASLIILCNCRNSVVSLTIPNAKPPAMLEESRCFTYAEDLPECFDRSKHYQGDLPCRQTPSP